MLISANALSRWRTDALGLRCWKSFDTRWMHLVATHPVALDSGGFVAARRYNGFPWSVAEYLNLAASAPFLWWASQDWCVEPQIAADEETVLDRISGTVRLNVQCLRGAGERGIRDRFMPVIQGWRASHYLRCLGRMSWALDFALIGVGSMCGRHVHGEHGILHILDALDRALGTSDTKLHLFGIKSQAIVQAAAHPRVASCDSQAFGVAARQDARKAGVSKSDRMVARTMTRWYENQLTALAHPPPLLSQAEWATPVAPERDLLPHEDRIAAAAEELRRLHEHSEIDWSTLSPQAAYELAFMED